jgi:hypothetical protein
MFDLNKPGTFIKFNVLTVLLTTFLFIGAAKAKDIPLDEFILSGNHMSFKDANLLILDLNKNGINNSDLKNFKINKKNNEITIKVENINEPSNKKVLNNLSYLGFRLGSPYAIGLDFTQFQKVNNNIDSYFNISSESSLFINQVSICAGKFIKDSGFHLGIKLGYAYLPQIVKLQEEKQGIFLGPEFGYVTNPKGNDKYYLFAKASLLLNMTPYDQPKFDLEDYLIPTVNFGFGIKLGESTEIIEDRLTLQNNFHSDQSKDLAEIKDEIEREINRR